MVYGAYRAQPVEQRAGALLFGLGPYCGRYLG